MHILDAFILHISSISGGAGFAFLVCIAENFDHHDEHHRGRDGDDGNQNDDGDYDEGNQNDDDIQGVNRAHGERKEIILMVINYE